MALRKSAVDAAAAQVHQSRETLARWEAEQASAEAELASLQSRAGGEVLANPDAAVGLTRSMQELRDRAEIARSAVAAAGPHVGAAESVWLAAQADAHEKAVEKAQSTLDRHTSRTDELLAELVAHEGTFVPYDQYLAVLPNGLAAGAAGWVAAKSGVLRADVWAAARAVKILRDLAEGRVPQPEILDGETWADVYPACVWSADAIVSAPAYVDTFSHASARIEHLEQRSAAIPNEIAQLEAEQASRFGTDEEGRPLARLGGIEARREEQRKVPGQLEAARSELAVLAAGGAMPSLDNDE